MFELIDLELDRIELEQLGLTEEEIAGYFLFFMDAYTGGPNDWSN